MKTIRLRGMRDIATIQGLSSQSVARSREQIVTELARMEHEKARLERELKIWVGNQQRAGERLRQVQERLERLQQALHPEAAERAAHPAEARPAGEKPAGPGESRDWKEVVLEF